MSVETTPVTQPTEKSGWGISRITIAITIVLVAIIVLIFLAGLFFALFSDIEQTAPRVQVVRDSVVIIIAVEGIVIIFAIAVLIAQIARLINLLKSEIRPILEDTQAAARSAKGTAEFVGNNVAQPIVKISAFAAGVGVLIRDLGGIRRAIRRPNNKENPDGTKE